MTHVSDFPSYCLLDQLYENVAKEQTKEFGSLHRETLQTKGKLASLLCDMGEKFESKRLYETVVHEQAEALGAMHEETLRTKGNLAILMKQLGDKDEAMKLYRQVGGSAFAYNCLRLSASGILPICICVPFQVNFPSS